MRFRINHVYMVLKLSNMHLLGTWRLYLFVISGSLTVKWVSFPNQEGHKVR